MEASWDGHDQIVRILLEHEADVNIQDQYRDTALKRASAKGQIVQILKDHGATK